jgi:hypothetical protein
MVLYKSNSCTFLSAVPQCTVPTNVELTATDENRLRRKQKVTSSLFNGKWPDCVFIAFCSCNFVHTVFRGIS